MITIVIMTMIIIYNRQVDDHSNGIRVVSQTTPKVRLQSCERSDRMIKKPRLRRPFA